MQKVRAQPADTEPNWVRNTTNCLRLDLTYGTPKYGQEGEEG